MKKTISFCFGGLLLASLCGCTSTSTRPRFEPRQVATNFTTVATTNQSNQDSLRPVTELGGERQTQSAIGYNFGELDDLASRHGTDKGLGDHGYTEVYERFFYPIKYTARKIFEIGISQGSSLGMFRDYFPNAVVYGIDILDCSQLNSDRIKTFVADQADREKLQTFIDSYGQDFDILLDDGGHTMTQQQVSFGYLFKFVKPGGYYIIEDVHTSLLEMTLFGIEDDRANTTLTMIDNFIRTGIIKSKYMDDGEASYLTDNIKYCALVSVSGGKNITCIFKKK